MLLLCYLDVFFPIFHFCLLRFIIILISWKALLQKVFMRGTLSLSELYNNRYDHSVNLDDNMFDFLFLCILFTCELFSSFLNFYKNFIFCLTEFSWTAGSRWVPVYKWNQQNELPFVSSEQDMCLSVLTLTTRWLGGWQLCSNSTQRSHIFISFLWVVLVLH